MREALVLIALIAGTMACSSADAQMLAEDAERLVVTRDTPFGELKPGSDITEALQWACDQYSNNQLPLSIPSGRWKISKTIRLPVMAGFVLLGEGMQHPSEMHINWKGTGTTLQWTGEAGGVMLDYSAYLSTIGNFTLVGKSTTRDYSKPGNQASVGILINKRVKGLGVGSVKFAPMLIANCDTGIQNGTRKFETNCDNLLFEWLVFSQCKVGFHGVNNQGLDIIFEYLSLYDRVETGILLQGGGHLVVQSGLTTSEGVWLKIPDTKGEGVGKNNGYIRLSNIQIDGEVGHAVTMIDCEEPYRIQIILDGCLRAGEWVWPDVPLAKVCGGNLLTIRNFTGFAEIVGSKGRDRTPLVSLTNSQLWGHRFTGDLKVRVRDCMSKEDGWFDLDWPVPSEATNETATNEAPATSD
ncbi:hypothetical protein [Aeoliella mucimassa]|uniref:Pectate lyase superfamily protein n=1 Tax=Aeoliella mucimassa TaxID=2527972 RepID=A0A518AR52_9BACT|nr:hypothetical protein [Aeoliella mucimassa]QDU57199.1 Pectate lyase superfamily protein [Aeoliella mucimassa]